MKVYLGSRYSRRAELAAYKQQLEAAGHIVTSRWLGGEFGDLVGKTNLNEVDPDAAAAAAHDRADVNAADIVVIFTDPPGQGGPNGRGGFHVEFGIGLQAGKRMVLVGSRVNSFHHSEGVLFFANWTGAWQTLFRPFDTGGSS